MHSRKTESCRGHHRVDRVRGNLQAHCCSSLGTGFSSVQLLALLAKGTLALITLFTRDALTALTSSPMAVQGGEYPDLDSAKQGAAKVLAEVAGDLLPSSEGCTIAIEVRDERGDHVLTTTLTFQVQRLSGL